MSNMEDRLRDAFQADAHTIATVHPFESPTAWKPAIQFREGRVMGPLAAAAALALIVGGAVVGSKLWHRSDDKHTAATGLGGAFPGGRVPKAAVPSYLVAVIPRSKQARNSRLDVISTKTGTVTGSILPSKRGQYFTAVAAANGQFIAQVTNDNVCETWLYSFGVSKAGKPTALTSAYGSPVPGFPTQGYETEAGALAVTPDAKIVAYGATKCSGPGGVVGVFRSASDRATSWHYVLPASPESLSLSADGNLLELVSNPSKPHVEVNPRRNAVWSLNARGRGGSLDASYRRVVKPPNPIASAALSPTGAVTFVVTRSSGSPRVVAINAYRTSTGKHLFLIGDLLSSKFDIGASLSLDPTGRYALISDWRNISNPPSQHPVVGMDLSTGRVFMIPGSAADQAISTAW
jgi:hypothetical protein